MNGTAWSACSNPETYTSLVDGSYEFAVRAVEGESADPTPATASFKVEATPPQTTITSAPSGRVPIGAVSVAFSSDQAGASFECSLDGGSLSSCATPYELASPASGPHDFEVRAVNGAGVADPSPDNAAWSSVEPEHDLCGSIDHDTTIGPDYAAVYVMTCDLTVEEGATLTVEPGSIIKAEGGTNLQVKGTLDAQGTAAESITFTSINDNSVGGSTGTGSPQPGDWQALEAVEEGSIDIEHAAISYARTGVRSESKGSIEIKNDSFTSQLNGAVALTREESATPTLLDNSSVDSGTGSSTDWPAYVVVSENLDADRLGGNTASGNGVPAVELAGQIGTSSTLPAEQAPWVIGSIDSWFQGGSATLLVPQGKTLAIAPGAVVKGKGGEAGPCDDCSLAVKGTLDAQGTAAESITFTSINDNSVGGSTGTGSPQPGDWQALEAVEEGSIDIEHAAISYARTGVRSESKGSIEIKNDSFTSQLNGAVALTREESATPTLLDNSSVDSGTGSSTDWPAYVVVSENLDADRLGGNTASGNGVPAVELAGQIGTSSTLPAEQAPWVIGSIDSWFQGGSATLLVPQGKTLAIAPGAVVKGKGGEAGPCDDCSLAVKGTLDAQGTAAEPITFTSINDNSVGGESGSGESAVGDWAGIAASTSASLVLEHAAVAYANTGINDSAGSSSQVKIDLDSFSSNATAVSVSAAVTSNAQVEDDDFDENGVAINASSNWSTLTADPADCAYVPTMDATGNTFDGSSDPLVSASDYAVLTGTDLASSFGVAGVKEYPDGWADNVQEASQDTITVHYEPCYDVTEPDNSYVAIAIPLNLTGDPIIPVS